MNTIYQRHMIECQHTKLFQFIYTRTLETIKRSTAIYNCFKDHRMKKIHVKHRICMIKKLSLQGYKQKKSFPAMIPIKLVNNQHGMVFLMGQ